MLLAAPVSRALRSASELNPAARQRCLPGTSAGLCGRCPGPGRAAALLRSTLAAAGVLGASRLSAPQEPGCWPERPWSWRGQASGRPSQSRRTDASCHQSRAGTQAPGVVRPHTVGWGRQVPSPGSALGRGDRGPHGDWGRRDVRAERDPEAVEPCPQGLQNPESAERDRLSQMSHLPLTLQPDSQGQ